MIYEKLKGFKKDFLWGTASAAYQVEGAYKSDNKGMSIWDEYVKVPGTTFKNTNGNVAVDHYNRYKEDVALMKELGLKSYRFSVAWTRILPKGKGEVNEKGIEFYENLIDELIKNGIEPILTIYHWDLPQELQELYGGWESREVIEDFTNYCKVLFERFNGKVKYWVTLNEQNVFIGLGYQAGLHPPGVKDTKRMQNANHIANLANAKAIKLFRDMKIEGQIGPSFAFGPNYAYTCKPEDVIAKENADELNMYWWLDVYLKGKYPTIGWTYMERVNLAPNIEEGDFKILEEGKPDFIGINYYRTGTVEANPLNGVGKSDFMNQDGKKGTAVEEGIEGVYKTKKNPYLDSTDWDWEIDATGLRFGLRILTSRYDNIPIMITENGLGAFDKLEAGEVHDSYRIDYLEKHIKACKEAVNDGVNLIGYCSWSYTDLLSWLNGYQKRYGFVYVDRDELNEKELKRYKKDSFYWYKKVIETNGDNI